MTSELAQAGELLLLGFVWTGIIGAVVIVTRVFRAARRQRRESRRIA